MMSSIFPSKRDLILVSMLYEKSTQKAQLKCAIRVLLIHIKPFSSTSEKVLV